MPEEQARRLVAVINNSAEVVELLHLVLEEAGYQHVAEAVVNFRSGERPVEAFLTQHDPQAVVWDIALPYAENWAFFCQIRESGVLQGRGVVLTTTNKQALAQHIGPHAALELLGKPYDINQLLDAVDRALAQAGVDTT